MKIIKTNAIVATRFCTLTLACDLSILEVYIPNAPVIGRMEPKKAEIAKAFGV